MKLKQFTLALYSCLSLLDSKDDVTFCFVSHVTSNSIWFKKKVALPSGATAPAGREASSSFHWRQGAKERRSWPPSLLAPKR